MSLLGCFKAMVEGFVIKTDSDRPIGLKHLGSTTNYHQVTIQTSRPQSTATPAQFRPTMSKKPKAAPAFAQVPPSSFSYENYVEYFRQQQYPKFPRRR